MNIEISPKEYERQLKWDDANMYCQLLSIDGKNDWRLPTIDELNDMHESELDFDGIEYWSSTEYDNETFWFQDLKSGYSHCTYPIVIFHVRPVRTMVEE